MRILFPILAVGLLQACGSGPDVGFTGQEMYSYFPFDGVRTWDYISSDDTVPYKLVGEMRSLEPDVIDGVNVYPVDYSIDCVANDDTCVDQLVRTLYWASNESTGVYIYSWLEGDQRVDFDPPLQIAEREMKVGEDVVTETAGATWTVRLEAFEECPVRFSANLGDCMRISIDDGDDNPNTGAGLVGDYWAVRSFGIVGIELVGETGIWELSKLDCEPEEECDGDW